MRKQSRRELDKYSPWQSATDMMTGIVFVLMLVVALLGLYILNTYNSESTAELGNQPFEESTTETEETTTPPGTEDETEATTADDDDEDETEAPFLVFGGGGGGAEEGIKSAVLVRVVDGETQNLIRQEGVKFELFNEYGGLQVLSTYYPEKISYKEFATMADGTFYLPEKVYRGAYFLRELSAPDGYDSAADQHFIVDSRYEWESPFTVTIPLFPYKNIVRVQVKDAETDASLGGSTFQVVALEDVTTLDGTIRYAKGTVVDTIVCDERGYGESTELYLGKYQLQQEKAPDYYAAMKSNLEVETTRTSGDDAEIQTISQEKTSITVTLTDELYTDTPLKDIQFYVSAGESTARAQIYRTDDTGSFVINNVEKGVTYHIREADPPEKYLPDNTDYTVQVDSDGRINGNAKTVKALTNRVLRAQVSLTDKVLRRPVYDEILVHVYDSTGGEVTSFISSGSPKTLEGLSVGSYYLTLGDDDETRYDFSVDNTVEVQSWGIRLMTWKSFAAIIIAAVVALFLLFLLILLIRWLLRRRKQKKADNQSEEQSDEPSGEA